MLTDINKYIGNLKIHTADGNTLPITVTSDVSSSITEVLVSPKLSTNLVSTGQDWGLKKEDCFSFTFQSLRTYLSLLFRILHLLIIVHGINVLDTQIIMYFMFYLNLVHFGDKGSPSQNDIHFDCHSCRLGKSKTLSFPTHQSTTVKPFDLIDNVWGMAPVTSHENYKYFVTSIDDYSRFTRIYFLHSKVKLFSVFKLFHAHIRTQFSTEMKILRSNNGGEYMFSSFQDSYRPMAKSLKEHVFQPHNRLRRLKEKIFTF